MRIWDKVKFGAIGYLGSWFIRALGATLRFELHGRQRLTDVKRQLGTNVIYTSWHARMIALIYLLRRQGIQLLVSQHKDGEIIYQICRWLGYDGVRGSTTRGGMRALMEMVRRGKQGHDLAVTPDGPRGPGEVAQQGIIHIAQRTGLPMVPLAYAASPCWKFGSWDEFRLPKPFARVVVTVGEPIFVSRDLPEGSFEACRAALEATLRELTAQAELGVQSGRSEP